jgi:hypothetical protein
MAITFEEIDFDPTTMENIPRRVNFLSFMESTNIMEPHLVFHE